MGGLFGEYCSANVSFERAACLKCEGFAQVFSLSQTLRAETNTAVGGNGTSPIQWSERNTS